MFYVSGNNLDGMIPESFGELKQLRYLYFDDNKFTGPLPSSMSKLVNLEELWVNSATLTGPLPDFSSANKLEDCKFIPSQLCRFTKFVPANSRCNLNVLPICEVEDCKVLEDWLPNIFDSTSCCQVNGIFCTNDRIVILDLSLYLHRSGSWINLNSSTCKTIFYKETYP
jgi:Leucine-rich repeat (LRR) protein